MKIYEPIVISLFTVLVLGASFLVGKNVGYREALTLSESAESSTLKADAIEQSSLSLMD